MLSGMRQSTITAIAALAALLALGDCTAAGATMPPLTTVEHVDLTRYLGAWYEVARYPNSFQKNCLRSEASYSLREDGDIRVVNTCQMQGGKSRSIEGKAWVVDRASNAKLKVRFFWPFSGSYWIVELGKEYEYAVVGHPGRKYLWILSRTPAMDPALFAEICGRLPSHGYDPGKLVKSE
jgi:apolipoprotein D and lipocalin family protein